MCASCLTQSRYASRTRVVLIFSTRVKVRVLVILCYRRVTRIFLDKCACSVPLLIGFELHVYVKKHVLDKHASEESFDHTWRAPLPYPHTSVLGLPEVGASADSGPEPGRLWSFSLQLLDTQVYIFLKFLINPIISQLQNRKLVSDHHSVTSLI